MLNAPTIIEYDSPWLSHDQSFYTSKLQSANVTNILTITCTSILRTHCYYKSLLEAVQVGHPKVRCGFFSVNRYDNYYNQ